MPILTDALVFGDPAFGGLVHAGEALEGVAGELRDPVLPLRHAQKGVAVVAPVVHKLYKEPGREVGVE